MENHGLTDKAILARTYSIQAYSSISLFDNAGGKEISSLNIKAYKLVPTSKNYKSKAAIAYLSLEEYSNARMLAEEIIQLNDFDLEAWLVLALINCAESEYIMNNVPKALQTDKIFQLNIVFRKVMAFDFEAVHALMDQGYSFLDIEENEPEKISYRNLGYWSAWSICAIAIYYSIKKDFHNFSIDDDAYDLPRLKKIQSVIKKILDTVDNTEIAADFDFLRFQYHYICLLENFNLSDLELLKKSYQGIQKVELRPTITFQLVRALASTNDEENLEYALKIIDGIPKEQQSLLIIFKIHYFSRHGDTPSVEGLVKEYYSLIEIIDELNIANILQLFELVSESNYEEAIKYLRDIAQKEAKKPVLRNILIAYADCRDQNVDRSKVALQLNSILPELIDLPGYIKDTIVRLYMDINLYEDAYHLINGYGNAKILNSTTVLLCNVLYNIPAKRRYLQAILKDFRDAEIEVPPSLINYDRNMAKSQYDFVRLKEICQAAQQFNPLDRALMYDLIVSLNYLHDTKEIEHYLPKLYEVDFTGNTKAIIHLFGILIGKELYLPALTFFYKYVFNSSDKELRQHYVMRILTNHNLLESESEMVEVDTKVIYTIDGVEQSIEITSGNIENPISKLLLNKKVGEEFNYQGKNFTTHRVVIKHVIDKFRLLHMSIMNETENPLNGFDIRQHSIDSNSETPPSAQLVQQLIKNYGAESEFRQVQINNDLQKYYNNTYSFTVIAARIFQYNPIEAFLYLTSANSLLFRIPPSSFYDKLSLKKESQFVLDIPTIVLFYQLSVENVVKIPKLKYIIPYTTRLHLDNILAEVKSQRNMIGNMNVTTRGIQAVEYGEGYHIDRENFYKNLNTWIEENCDVVHIPERIEMIEDLGQEEIATLPFQCLFDNHLLSQRENYILLTSDMAYFNDLKASAESVYSAEFFLKSFSPSEHTKINEKLLSKKIVGLRLTEEELKSEFIKRQSKSDNYYDSCLFNLTLWWNNSTNIKAAISFIRWLMLNSVMQDSQRLIAVEEVLSSLLPGMEQNKGLRHILSEELSNQFRLLNSSILNTVLYCMNNVVNYIKSGRNSAL